ncbi:MAG: hypothetical protein QNJ46_00550 [Leptolyngbyaceae cyanobacterium MO_188.B28]|nr:hypothetical protein [Leptolyngbyaceae cyanobacterium MO_188.B28]
MDVTQHQRNADSALANHRHDSPLRISPVGLLGVALSLMAGFGQPPALSQEFVETSPMGQTRRRLLDTDQMPLNRDPQEEIQRNLAITQDTISDTSLTLPSLWWSRDQVVAAVGDLPQFIETWVAFRGSEEQPRRVDVVVNPQIWNLLNYLERYAVLNQFGATAKSYGYSTRFFRGLDLTGAYICDFSQSPDLEANAVITLSTLSAEALTRIDCIVELDYRGRGSIRGNPSPGGP